MSKSWNRTISLLLTIVLVLTLLPAMELPALAASVTTGVTGLSADYSGGSWSGGSGALSGSIAPSESSGCTGTTYSAATSTLTLQNTSGSEAVLSFDYAPSVGSGGSASVAGTAVTTSGVYSATIAANGTVKIEIKSGASKGASTSIHITNVTLALIKDVTTTFLVPENGSYTVDGTAVTAQTTKTQSNALSYSISATPAAGYKFFGWSWRATASGTDNYFSTAASTTRSFNDDGFVVPIFVSKDIPVWGVGDNLYTDLNAAIADNSGNTVFLVSDGTLPAGDYVVPNGKTVLIPFDSANTVYRNAPEVIYNSYSTPSKYRELIMPNGANITVQSGGAICVGGKLSSKGQMGGNNGTPTGPDGRIKMMTGSNITLENGANLYCWGYIFGSGSVEAKSGATVYEAYQIKDWRGGSATSNCYDYTFIFSQYYVQNIEVPLKLNAGAMEKLYSSVNASSSAYPVGATLVGNGGLFNITSGYLVKDYIESTDRLQIDIYGNASVAPMSLTGLPIIGSISTDSYELPITNNITVNVHSGTTSITQDIKLQPGVEFNIDNGASATINSGKKVYVYDLDNWGKFTGTAKLYVIGYSVANGTTAKRNAASLKDAVINVNGTLNVSGKLYTSEAGANITSSGKTGQIIYTAAPDNANATIYEMADNKTKTAVAFNPARMHNGISDPAYTASAGAAANTTFVYCETHNKWERSAPSTQLNYNANGGSGTMQVQTLDRSGTIAANSFTREGYDFSGWNTKADGTGEAYAAGDPAHFTSATANVTLYAQWTPGKFTVIWKNADGTTLETDNNVTAGTTPTYDGETPTKPATAQYSYTFAGWSTDGSTVLDPLPAVSSAATYTAVYTETLNSYTVSWLNYDGAVLSTSTVTYGDMPTAPAETPTRASDDVYYYIFSGWTPTITAVTGDTSYTAVYSPMAKYAIHFDAGGGTGTMTDQAVEPGEVVRLKANSFTREGYDFLRWIGSNGYTYEDEGTILAVGSMTLTAEWKPQETAPSVQIRVNWYDNYKNKGTCDSNTGKWTVTGAELFQDDYYNSTDQFVAPAAPSHLGLSFLGWSIYISGGETAYAYMSVEDDADGHITATDILTFLSGKVSADTVADIYAQYEAADDTVAVVLKYKLDGAVTETLSGAVDNVPAHAKVGTSFTLTANAESADGYKFDHWEYNGNEVKSTKLTIRASSTADVEVYACYVTAGDGLSANSLYYVTDTYAETVNGVNKVAITMAWNMPKDEEGNYLAEIVSVGFYCGKDYGMISAEPPTSPKSNKKPTDTHNGSYTLHISSKTSIEDNIYARPYIIYKDAEGAEHTVISDEIYTLNWTELAEKGVR